ncbi:MAG: hypothetical protein JNN11_03640 [Candidatus Doudnabacteria bacterium]|nr:hypothetical protein [Candidatus Doudnabacteria bacterium]
MSEIQQTKLSIISQLQGLCAHCACGNNRNHRCPVKEISLRIQSLRGVPLVVNSEFKGMLWA